ncbi:regulatory protein RecX [Candidatus Caldatribacterium saccharofermentans]
MIRKLPLTIDEAIKRALRKLARRMCTSWEVREALRREGFPDAVLEETIALLSEKGYLDDQAYVSTYVEERRQRNPRGFFALRHELKERGIPSPLLAELRSVYPLEAEVEDVVRLLSFWQAREEDRERFWRRLRTRGFAEEAIEWGWSLFFGSHRP